MSPATLLARSLAVAAIGIGLSVVATSASAYPDKTVRIIMPYQGGAADNMSRLVAAKLAETFRQPFIVEYKTGANGIIASDFVTKAPADGYTLLYEASTLTFTPALYKKVPYDLAKDLQPIAQLMSYPYVVVVNPAVPASNLGELLRYLKANGNRTNVASGSASLRVLGELFKQVAGVDLTFVPYKGGGPATVSVMAGETQMAFQDLPTIAPLVAAGRMRALAVTSPQRARVLPDVVSFREAGMPEFEVVSWHGMFAPANTPSEIVNRLNAELHRIMALPDMAARMATLGAVPTPGSVADFTTSFRGQVARWKDVAAKAQLPLAD